MMERLLARGREIAARRVELVLALLEQAARDELPADLTVERDEGGVAIGGKRVGTRLLGDGRLAGLVSLVRGMLL